MQGECRSGRLGFRLPQFPQGWMGGWCMSPGSLRCWSALRGWGRQPCIWGVQHWQLVRELGN